MTKEELEKEVEEYLENKYCENVCTCDEVEDCKRGIRVRCMSFDCKKTLIINFVEPREKRITELEKACDETQKLLDKQIEETYKMVEENEELKRGHHYEVEVINGRPTGKAILVPDNLAYAKSIIEQLMNMKNLSGSEQIEVIKKAKAFLH